MAYYAKIKIDRKEIEEKLDRLNEITREIRDIVRDLEFAGVVELTDDDRENEKAASGDRRL